jgi:hypothetical protein
MLFYMYDRKIKQYVKMEFNSIQSMWQWHDKPVACSVGKHKNNGDRYKPYDAQGNVCYRVARFV